MPPQSDTLQSLLEISYLVGSVLQLGEILDKVSSISAGLMESDVCSIYLLDDTKQTLVMRSTHGLSKDLIGKASVPVDKGIKGWSVRNNQLSAVADVRKDNRYHPIEGSGEEPYVALLCSPLRIQEEVIGVMAVRRKGARKWTKDDVTLFEMICKQVAIVIEKSRLHFEKVESERLAAIGMSLSEIAHYIKNLLQGMSGGQYFLETGLKRADLDKALRGWYMLDKNLRKIASLVQNMLNFSRSSSLQYETENLNGLLYELAGSVEESARQRNIAVKMTLDDTIPEMPIAYDALHEAFLNLLTNAIDAIPDGTAGTVSITSRLDLTSEVSRVTIADTGVGIPEDRKGKIFNLFYSTKGRKGTGIGLSVTRKIIEEHGGRISFESEEGKGTTFIVELPLVRRVA